MRIGSEQQWGGGGWLWAGLQLGRGGGYGLLTVTYSNCIIKINIIIIHTINNNYNIEHFITLISRPTFTE